MKIKIRQAKNRDRGLFLKLMRKFAEEEYKNGSGMPVTENNIELFGKYFDAYTNGDLEGVVLFFREDAFVMYGDQGSLFDFDKKRAHSYAVYVDAQYRGQGVAQALRKKAFEKLKEKGFDVVVGLNNATNEEAVKSSKASGFEIDSYMVMYNLTEENE